VLDESLVTFVLGSLPPAPARLLAVGAGDGELAEHLRARGYEVVAIDPAGGAPAVQQVALLDLDAPPASFDAAIAVVSLHHVEPLTESCEHLAELVRPGGALVIDEFDIGRLDMRAADWWAANRADGHEHPDLPDMVAHMRSHLHPLDTVLMALEPSFEFPEIERVPYLYRWVRRPELRVVEQADIAGDALPATGARVVGVRRPPSSRSPCS
jgi:2-polyprenyl-3-methyl-5-hydroxy-6-metoxy-1,4-benzoquinol methylase